MRDYPPPPLFAETTGRMSADALRELQNTRFLARVTEAWGVPFYRKRWRAAGIEPGDIRSLDDIARLPSFTSDDLKAAGEAAPPFGSHHPFGREGLGTMPLKLQTSGGTTGKPRVTLFDPIAWEVQGIQAARALYAQGARPGDVIQLTYTNSLANAAWCASTGIFHWLGCVPVTAGSGIVTSSEKHLEFARDFGTNGWFARGEYLSRLAEVARETGFDLHDLKTKFMHSYIGADDEGHLRKRLQKAWNAPLYDNYGSHETGPIAFECAAQDRKHISEDTVFVEVADVDTLQPVPAGTPGTLILTSLHRSVPPFIRYNIRDMMALFEREQCGCGLCTRKLSGFLGRADEMVKLRGTNVYPMACQTAILRDDRGTGEFICVVEYRGDGLSRREHMTVRVERTSRSVDAKAFAADLERAYRRDLGVRVDVEIVDPGSLAEPTRFATGKARRLMDLRK